MDQALLPHDYISPEILRNALYGKWCNVLGQGLTRDNKAAAAELLERKKGRPTFRIFFYYFKLKLPSEKFAVLLFQS